MEFAIDVRNLKKSYSEGEVLKKISFSVKKGTIHGFLGPNGAGKTTTMKIIVGLLPPNEGDVKVEGSVGFLPENPPLYNNMIVKDFLKFVAEIHFVPKKLIQKRIEIVSEKCGITSIQKRLIGNLSKGYRQRVGIAQALVFDPEVLVFDEPTVGLDPSSIIEIRDLIRGLKNKHTILFSSHQLHEVELLCSDITIINQGKILQSGPISEIRKSYQNRQIVHAVVSNWTGGEVSNELKSIQKILPCKALEILPKGNETELKFILDSAQDLRSRVGKYLFDKKCDLLSLKEEKLDIEEIFKLATKSKPNETSENRVH